MRLLGQGYWHRIALVVSGVIVLTWGCAKDPGDGFSECEADSQCGIGALCIEGACITPGQYADCINAWATCGGTDPICLLTDSVYAGHGACTWECMTAEDCWPAPSGYQSDCLELTDGRHMCFVVCGESESCPEGMECVQGACLYPADGCGQTASPSGPNLCSCDPGLVWCSATPGPGDLECCNPKPAGDDGNVTNDDGGTCCRYCTSGKPCGDSCIAVDLNCEQPPGCACYG